MENANAKPKLKPRGKPFQKGAAPGPGRGKRKPATPAGQDIARDMEIAYSTAETPGEAPGITQARKLAKEDYTKFLTLYARFRGDPEPEGYGPGTREEVPVAAAAGPRELKVDELIDQLLAEWENE